MITVEIKALQKRIKVERVLGEVLGSKKSPTLIFLAGIHGNETTGLYALKKVIDSIKKNQIPVLGNIYAVTGNLSALKEGKRYSEVDLNRIWTHQKINSIKYPTNKHPKDLDELKEIYEVVKGIIKTNNGPFYFIDLHTTSAKTSPFITISDSINNREFSSKFPIPIILGIEEYLEGAFLSYVNEFGHIALGFEGGQHTDIQSIKNAEAFIWLTLVHSGCLRKKEVKNYQFYKTQLRKASMLKNKFYEIDYRFEIEVNSKFKMIEGFNNFDKIAKKQILARNNGNSVYAPCKGRIFMPLYQKQGDDGFFVITKVSIFWLILSKFLRKLQMHQLLRLLPGINQFKNDKHTLMVNPKITKFLAIEIFHLFGYRKKVYKIGKWLITKRDRKVSSLN